ncbi:MAG: hypothetical protein HC880_02110 [Bacteroidia bacterium]|nr:hypothetical protein [Bacteroidia bacterium]
MADSSQRGANNGKSVNALHAMKILHLNTSDAGGAARASIRLHEGLIQSGMDSQMLVLYQYQPDKAKIYKLQPPSGSLTQKIRDSLAARWDNRQKKQKLGHKTQNYEVFSFPTSIYDLSRHPLVQTADIVHLHWIAGFVDYPSFLEN